MFIGFALFLIISLILEGTVTTLPLILVCLLCFAIILRSPMIFFVAFISGLLLDLFTLHTVGSTSVFLLLFLLLVFLYQKKYEIDSLPFVGLASFFGSLAYLLLFGFGHAFVLAVVTALSGLLLYKIATQVNLLQTK